ncbi:MAG TPA: CPBP family glutamic-type intramembrane protease [Kofleriaceae bacterium]|nr:CPBP family glutamic-type intramembrane protease [Kofleriaceae bacterium]
MTGPARPMRGLVPLELAALVGIALVPMPIPRAIPLLGVASVSRWLRGHSWGEVMHGRRDQAGIAALAGVVALVLALAVGTPVIELVSGRDVEWSQFPIVRGSAAQLFSVGLIVVLGVVAMELVLRGWVVERVLELRRGSAALAVAVGALAEAAIVDGDVVARAGGLVFGIALGWLYIAARRSAVAPICARLTFSLIAIVLEALRLIG